MPSFFFWSESGDGAFLAKRLEEEGHRVRTYFHDPHAKNVYRGILKTPAVQRASPERGEIVIFDMVKFGPQADRLRHSGYKIIGASGFADAIEIDRPAGAKIMRDIGIQLPETYTFKSLNDGQKFLRTQKGKWYYKPSGNQDTASTFGCESEMLIRYLEWCRKDPPKQFELQRGLDDGTEISLEGWFDGTRWVWPFNSTVEDKKLMTGDKGPRTGCMSNCVWAYEDSRPTLALKTVTRIAPLLEAAGHVGPIDLNMMLDKEGEPYGLEWSPRFGYDALHALCELCEGDLGHQLALFVDGRLDKFDVRTDVYAMTLRLSVPPYPSYEHGADAEGVPVDATLINDQMAYLGDVMMSSNGPVVSGSDGSFATLVVTGTQLDEMRKKLVQKADSLNVPNIQYRIDPVKRVESVVTALSRFGYDSPSVRKLDQPKPMFDFSRPSKEEMKELKPPMVKPGFNNRPNAGGGSKAMPGGLPPNNWDQPTYK